MDRRIRSLQRNTNRRNIAAILLMNFIGIISCAQSQNVYQIVSIPDWDKFEVLTTYEENYDRMNQQRYEMIDRMYDADSLYVKTISEEKKALLYKEVELKSRVNYIENRARFFVEYVEEDTMIIDKTFGDNYTVSTECQCELLNDTVQIKMGIWVFGGFFYEMTMHDRTFSLIYGEDADDAKPFKYFMGDTSLVSNVSLNITDAILTFDKLIQPKIGEQLNGHLQFRSPEYYVHSHHRRHSNDDEMHSSVTRGEIYFTCKLRAPLAPPEEWAK